MLGVLGQATLNFVAVATLLFFFFCECPKFCNLAKQRRKVFVGVSEVGKIDFVLYLFLVVRLFLGFLFSSAAIARQIARHIFVSASSSSTLTLVLPLSTSFRFALAGVVAFAFASTFARAFARILTLQLRRQALLVVAIILIVLPLPTEGTGDGTPVVIRQLLLGASVGLLLLSFDYEAVLLLAVRGVLQVALLVSGITPEELPDVYHDTGVFGGSPLPRSGSLPPFAMASRASTSRTVVVQVLVAFFLQRQLQQ